MATESAGYPKPGFRSPSPSGFVYVGLSVDPPHTPLVRSSAERDDAIGECLSTARRLSSRDDVLRARVFEAVLIPPLKGSPRFDVMMLVETASPERNGDVVASAGFDQLGADLVMPADNPARIGDPESPSTGIYLFNHFTAPDGDAGVRVWEGLAGWYTAKTGVDNSIPLRSVGDERFAFVNYARLPGGAASFMVNQLVRPSFHRFVRGRLRANGMVALPILCRPV
ncbi:hypothetical protein [Nocardiopsis halotolerans]|uniref:hypothetical protein n=1 Tax=Nocardiopsis halotolerans TaxID=124252 RepID=UPI00034C9401|nr:hypothetical protein [Nocardiopsis halotolerans]